MNDEIFDAIIISDLHLGSDICQVYLLENFLNGAFAHTKASIIQGDYFDDLNF